MIQPIWKDCYVTLGAMESATFRVEYDDRTKTRREIFQGKAFRRPGESMLMVRINDICANYLNVVIDFSTGEDFVLNDPVSFIVSVFESDTWVIRDVVTFYANYSYDYQFNPLYKGLSCPINGRVTQDTLIPYSVPYTQTIKVTMDGVSTDIEPSGSGHGGYYIINPVNAEPGGQILVRDWDFEKEIRYDVVISCARYALYYVNAYGGVDLFLIEGNHTGKDELQRHTREVSYDNREISNAGKINFASEITKSLTLHTSWLTDEQSARMHHLLNANQVLLYDIKENQYIPVLLTNTTTEYKTYKGNGGKLTNYKIEVTFANDMIRR